MTASHLGRAYAVAYRDEGECAAGLGVEVGALVRPAASGGAFSGDSAGGAATAAAALVDRGRGEGGAGDRASGVAWGRGAASRPGEGGRPRHVQRRRTAATWPAPGGSRRAPRARERGGGGSGPRRWLGRKGGGSAQQRLSPFSFFLNFFSQILSKFIWTM